MAKKGTSCKRTTIKFKTKRGKPIQFAGRSGPGCGPRPKPKTSHLRVYQTALAAASRSCARKNLSRGPFLNCVASAMPRVRAPRR